MKKSLFTFVLTLAIASGLMAQLDSMQTWHHQASSSEFYGVSTQQAYDFLKSKNRKSQPIIVAIIDSGTDIKHEDLKDQKWTNPNEIAGNGIDDDKNGYIDDTHGWNFIGGKNGNLEAANLEITRIYRRYKAKYDGKTMADMKNDGQKKQYLEYTNIKNKYEKKYTKSKGEYDMVMQLWKVDSVLLKATGKEDYTKEDLANLKSDDKKTMVMASKMSEMFDRGLSRKVIMDYKKHVDNAILYQLNLSFDPRPEIIGDDPMNMNDRNYGNNDVIGARASHGTHVAGIIAATRNNNIGMDGIADNVQLMIIRTVPDGDERDKDVANAIRYAVDNGAKIINMSFGKSTTTLKLAVDMALAYAEKKGVLLVHAAGNDGKNIDKHSNYPTPVLTSTGKAISTWLTVGASAPHADSTLIASFSNYGRKTVDIFAPGVDIYATTPNNTYEAMSGTSMAAPVVTGVAALVWAHYPTLTAKQLKKILIKSGNKLKKLVVKRPISSEERKNDKFEGKKIIKFKKLSRKGVVINALSAVKMAEKKTK